MLDTFFLLECQIEKNHGTPDVCVPEARVKVCKQYKESIRGPSVTQGCGRRSHDGWILFEDVRNFRSQRRNTRKPHLLSSTLLAPAHVLWMTWAETSWRTYSLLQSKFTPHWITVCMRQLLGNFTCGCRIPGTVIVLARAQNITKERSRLIPVAGTRIQRCSSILALGNYATVPHLGMTIGGNVMAFSGEHNGVKVDHVRTLIKIELVRPVWLIPQCAVLEAASPGLRCPQAS